MNKLIYALTLTFLVSACGQTNSSSENSSTDPQPDSATTADKPIPGESDDLDRIDKENNESIIASGDDITKATVSLKDGDSTINLYGSSTQDHRFFGYAKPDVQSERLILISIFTNDVEGNPFGCKLGAYYDTNDLILKYVSTTGDFVEALAFDEAENPVPVFFEKKWIEFD